MKKINVYKEKPTAIKKNVITKKKTKPEQE